MVGQGKIEHEKPRDPTRQDILDLCDFLLGQEEKKRDEIGKRLVVAETATENRQELAMVIARIEKLKLYKERLPLLVEKGENPYDAMEDRKRKSQKEYNEATGKNKAEKRETMAIIRDIYGFVFDYENLAEDSGFTKFKKQKEAEELERMRKESEALFKKSLATQAHRKAELESQAELSQRSSSAEASRVRQESGIPDPERIERNREKYIKMVLKEGGIKMNSSFSRELSQKGSAGFQTVVDKRLLQQSDFIGGHTTAILSDEDSHRGKRADEVLSDHKRNEIVVFNRLKTEEYAMVKIPEKRGFFGGVKESAKTERRSTGRRIDVLHSETVSNGKTEPAVLVEYSAKYNDKSSSRSHMELWWIDYSRRHGQMLNLEIILPESSAKELQIALQNDPALIRKIAERVYKEKVVPQQPESWEKPTCDLPNSSMRPPYEAWDSAEDGGKIYIHPLDGSNGWHEENDRKIVN